MDPRQTAADYVIGKIGPEDLPDVMTTFLVQGLGELTVAELAGTSPSQTDDINELAPSAFAEMAVDIPTKHDDIWVVAHYLAAEVLADRIVPHAAARTLLPLVSEDFEDPDELLNFRYVAYDWAESFDTPEEQNALVRAACARLLQ